ncbi:MAG: methyltransferase domain-containing protein [Methanosarcinaceae archaeon]
MIKNKNIEKHFFGNEIDRMPNIAFRIMSFLFKVRDSFSPRNKRLDYYGIKKDYVVIDYGCGPGSYLEKASKLVGINGKIYAVDIHELAIKSAYKIIAKHNLKNIEPVLAKDYSCEIKNHVADLIYCLDTFHMIKDSNLFLIELCRLLKKDGVLIIDDGHQSRKETKRKIMDSKMWDISNEFDDHLKCVPKNRI